MATEISTTEIVATFIELREECEGIVSSGNLLEEILKAQMTGMFNETKAKEIISISRGEIRTV